MVAAGYHPTILPQGLKCLMWQMMAALTLGFRVKSCKRRKCKKTIANDCRLIHVLRRHPTVTLYVESEWTKVDF